MSYSNRSELLTRSKAFAAATLRFVDTLPTTVSGRTIGNQLARSGCSQAANYREARRARSRREFISKIGISIQEIDESSFWLELALELFPDLTDVIQPLHDESNELTAMFVASSNTAKRNSQKQ